MLKQTIIGHYHKVADESPKFGIDYCLMSNVQDAYNPFGPDCKPVYFSCVMPNDIRRTLVFKNEAVFEKWYFKNERTDIFV